MRDSSLGVGLCLGLCVVAPGCGGVVDQDAPGARVRVAHLSPDAPAIDFCLAEHGTSMFGGPVLAAEGAPLGVAYGNVTRYLDAGAIRYDVRLVAPGATDCASPLVPDLVDLPELAPGATVTLAAIGKLDHGAGQPFQLRAYADESAAAPDRSRLRFIHASPGTPPVDVGFGGGVLFAPAFEAIAFGGTRAHDNGYVAIAPAPGDELAVRATGTIDDVLSADGAGLPAGALATAFAIGELGSTTHPLDVLLCNDSAPAHGAKTECKLVGRTPERARIRIAHLSPDAPAVDVCIAPGGGAFRGPMLAALGGRAGLAFPQVTTYVSLPAGSYDVRVVAATESTCANPAVADTRGVTIGKGVTATVAALGVLDRSGAAAHDPAFRLAVFPDATTTVTNKGKLRFIHASPGTPPVNVGIGAGGTFALVFGNVGFGTFAMHPGIDPAGFADTTLFQSPVSARAVGSMTDALTIPSVTLEAGSIATAFAIGGKSGGAYPLRVLLCSDQVAAGLLTKCAVVP